MKSVIGVAAALSTSLSVAAIAMPGAATAAPAVDARVKQAKSDDRPDARHTKRRELKQKAIEQVVTGKSTIENRGGSQAVKVGPQWVEYGTEETAQLFSILVDFGDQIDPRFPDQPAGPVHNQIPAPAEGDNSTYWKPDFSEKHFEDMFFNGLADQDGESFKQLYKEMSSGRFDLQGDVTQWVKVPYNSASYGETESNTDMSRFIEDAANAWVAAEKAAGKSDATIVDYLKRFDVHDRYDHDRDGDFAEPDGYIDHFQAIHAGVGEEAGGPTSAIWSHRWAARPGAAVGPEGAKFGGVQIGNTGIWIRDYTTEPENGGLGVFAHEFAHDLGLPDYYDTAGGENGTGFWTLMSSGSWLGHGDGAIGTTPNHMGAHEKLFLGWLDYATVQPRSSRQVTLGPSHHATNRPQAVIVNLPQGQNFVNVGEPIDGKYLYSGTGDNHRSSAVSPSFTVPAGGSLAAKVKYSIELDWDYAYAEISTDGGTTFKPLQTNLSTNTDPYDQNDGNGITGSSNGAWVDLTADLSAYAGQTAKIRFRHWTDGAYHETGFLVDNIAVGSALTEDAEDVSDWTLNGFRVIEGNGYTQSFEHYYIGEYRQYAGYDVTLKEGPYNFGWGLTSPDRVEHFPYQDGLHITYVNGLYTDNNTSAHPGGGEALPVDARAKAMRWSDGSVARNRIQTYDATFGLQATDPLSLHREVANKKKVVMTTLTQASRPAVPVFDDTDPNAYYDTANPRGSVKVGGTGTTIKVLSQDTNLMTVAVN